MNCAQIAGYLGADPRLHRIDDEKVVCNLRVAVRERKDETTWVDVAVWGKQGENCAEYLEKGQWVAIFGRMQQPRAYNDSEGNPRANVSLICSHIDWGPKSGSNNNSTSDEPKGDDDGGISDEDIPF